MHARLNADGVRLPLVRQPDKSLVLRLWIGERTGFVTLVATELGGEVAIGLIHHLDGRDEAVAGFTIETATGALKTAPEPVSSDSEGV